MANYSIAAQGRAVKAPDIGAMLRQRAQMQAQQQTAQAEADARREKTGFERSREDREVEAANLDKLSKVAEIFRNDLSSFGRFGDVASMQAVRDKAVRLMPELESVIPSAELLATDRDAYTRAKLTADKLADKEYGNAKADFVIDPKTNKLKVVNSAGIPGASFSYDTPDITSIVGRPPPQTNNTPNPLPLTASTNTNAMVPGAQLTPGRNAFNNAFPRNLDAAVAAIAKGASISDPALSGLTQEQFGEAQRRASQMVLEKPISYEGQTGGQPPMNGAMPPAPVAIEESRKILQTAFQTGVINASNLEILRQTAGGNDQGLADTLRQNNVRVMPNEAEVPGMNDAVYRPTGDQMFTNGGGEIPRRQEVQYTPSQFPPTYGKDPMQSPAPGSAIVPIPRVRAEAEAGRAGKDESYATQRAQEQAQADVKFLERAPAATRTVTNTLSVLDRMVGDAYIGKKTGEVIYPPKGRRPHPGFDQTVGLGFPGLRFLAGSPQADFDAMLGQITGATFLEAFETLKGGGQITQPEGEKATKAISRLGRNISEKEFIAAVNELRSIMRSALQRTEARTARLNGGGGGIPASAIEYLRKNPALRPQFEAKYGKGSAAKALRGS